MTAPSDKTVFISWSGDLARGVAEVLQEWLPTLMDDVDPWVSSVSIQAGMHWLGQVNARLDTAVFGIVLVTLENKGKEWLNFEAGALGQRFVGNERGRVVPITVDFTSATELPTTLSQFQAVPMDRDGLWRAAQSLAESLGKNESAVQRRFDGSWDDLKTKLDAALTVEPSAPLARSSRKWTSCCNRLAPLVKRRWNLTTVGRWALPTKHRRSPSGS